jgi:hypothetical protein
MWVSVIPVALLFAHVASKAATGPWSAELNGTWLWHAGDDMQWASPAFDDSAWPVLRVPGPLPPTQQYWIRLSVQLGRVSDPGLLVGPIAYAYEAYWDGQRIGNLGAGPPRPAWFAVRPLVFRIPLELADPGGHVIAYRVFDSRSKRS